MPAIEKSHELANEGKNVKKMISIRIDNDVLEWFKSHSKKTPSGRYQTTMNDVLRQYMEDMENSLKNEAA